jgi:restriction endonuclease S subunit
LSELERTKRIDSEFYKKENLFINKLLQNYHCESIADVSKVSDGNHFEVSSSFQDVGIPYYRGQNISSNFYVEQSNPICIDNDTFNRNYMIRSHLQKKDVLLSIVGTIGSVALVTTEDKATCSCKIAILRPKKIVSEFLAAFLYSKFGQNQIKKFVRGAVQTGFLLEDTDQIKVPILSNTFQLEIERLVKSAHAKLEESKSLYAEAEKMLLDELGLSNWQPSTENVAVKSLKESFLETGRLDAEYFQPKYDELLELIQNYSQGFCKLKDIGKFANGSLVSDTFYIEKAKRAYIRIKELSLSQPIKKNDVVYIDDNFQRTNETIVNTNDFVIATIGNTIGKTNLITKDFDGSFISNNTSKLSLFDKNSNFYFYELLLRSLFVQMQVEREFTQTAQPKISNSSFEEMIIPKIPNEIQKQTDLTCQRSYLLQDQSKQLLELAKQAVEVAIEQDEDAALAMIKIES